MLIRQPRPAARTAPLRGRDSGLALGAFLFAIALITLLLIGIAKESVWPDRPATVTVQNASAGVQRSGAGELGTTLAARGDTPGRRLGEGLVLAPRMIEDRVAGYVITAASDAAELSKAKLRPGDMLIDLDDRPLAPTRIRSLGDELSRADSMEVTYERDGQIRKRVVDLTH